MKIHKNTQEHFLAELSKQDIKDYSLDFKSLDFNNEKTKAMISDLLCSSKLELGGSAPLPKLNINIIEHKDGSALVLITLIKKKAYKLNGRTNGKAAPIAVLNETTALLKLCETLSKLNKITVLRLLSDGNNFALEIKNCGLDKNNLKAVCLEYGDSLITDEALCAQIREHYSVICENVTPRLFP